MTVIVNRGMAAAPIAAPSDTVLAGPQIGPRLGMVESLGGIP